MSEISSLCISNRHRFDNEEKTWPYHISGPDVAEHVGPPQGIFHSTLLVTFVSAGGYLCYLSIIRTADSLLDKRSIHGRSWEGKVVPRRASISRLVAWTVIISLSGRSCSVKA